MENPYRIGSTGERAIVLLHDGCAPSEIARELRITESQARSLVTEAWAYDKRKERA